MNPQLSAETPIEKQPAYRVPHVAVAVLLGIGFLVASLLAALLPALAVVYLVVGFAIQDIVVVLALWAASATLSIATFLAISRTYAETVLRDRVVPALPVVTPSQD